MNQLPETMPAVAYRKSLPVDDAESLLDTTLPVPQPGPRDLLVRVEDQPPGADDRDAAAVIAASRRYLTDFEAAVEAGADARDVVRAMNRAHGDRGNPYTLYVSAAAQFPPGD
ncbi:hypothetical protein SFUMM280S_05126 [Streptomyces fumanus]